MEPESSSPRLQEPAGYMPVYFIEPATEIQQKTFLCNTQ